MVNKSKKQNIVKKQLEKPHIMNRWVLNFFILVIFLISVIVITQQIDEKQIYIELKDSENNEIKANIMILNEDGSESYLKEEGIYNLIIKPHQTPISEIKLNNINSKTIENLRIDELNNNEIKTPFDEIKQVFAIDPVGVDFDNGTIKIRKAIGRELYKCEDYDFEEKVCNDDWKKLMDLTPGYEYEIYIDKYDPVFVEVDVQTCVAEDLEEIKSSFNNLCDSSNGSYLEDDDDFYEVHKYKNNRNTKYYAGIKIEAYNPDITNCSDIIEVYLCYKWWKESFISICSIEVDADNETSWSQVSDSCPGQTEPQNIECVDVTGLENWSCSNFFGINGTKAKAKSEVTTNGFGAKYDSYWDVFYFNVTYNESDNEPPEIILEEPEEGAEFLIPEVHIKYIVDDLNNILNCSLFLDNRTNQTHYNPKKNIVNEFVLYNLTNGTYMWHIRCSDSRHNARETARHKFNITNPLLKFENITYPSMINLSDAFNISVNITQKNIDSVWADFENENTTLVFNSTSGFYQGTINVPIISSTRNVSFYVYANDTAGNTNSSNESIFVDDNIKPHIKLISPENNAVITNNTAIFIFNVTDYNSEISKCNLILDNMNFGDELDLSQGENNITKELVDGNYEWKIRCYDGFGNFNYSETRNLNVDLSEVLVNISIMDSELVKVASTGAFISYGNIKYYYNETDGSLNIATGNYDLFISTKDKIASKDIKMSFKNIDINKNITRIINIDDGSNLDYKKNTYILNKYINENVLVETYSNGDELYKCEEWNFTERKCYGQWKRIKKVSPGEKYKFLLTSNDPAYGEGSSFTLKTITIDGDFSDWDSVIINEKNTITDGIAGVNDADDVGNSKFDLTDFAFTWDEKNLYFYFKKVAMSTFQMSLLVYIDTDLDGYMNSTDKVMKYVWSGIEYNSYLYNYVPSSGNGDLMGGDGETMPGTVTNQTSLESNIIATNEDRIKLESKVPWSYLGDAGIPLYMHISSASSTANNLPSNIKDNMPLASSLIIDVSITPDRESSSIPGGNVKYNHTIKNFGNNQDIVDISTSATRPWWNVSLYYLNGTLLSDSDNDDVVDVILSPGEEVDIFVNISIPANETNGVEDNTIVWATSSLNSSISDSVIDTTHLGGIIILPDRTGTIVAGLNITYNHTVYNNQNTTDVFEINFNSTQNWTAVFYIDGIILNDSDEDGYIDFNATSNAQYTLFMNLSAPSSSAIGTTDYSTIKIFSKNDASNYDSVVDETEIRNRIELYPDNKGYVGMGDFIFYEHIIKNNWNSNDTLNVNISSTKNWNPIVYCCDKTTELNDSNDDGIPDVQLGAFGEQKTIYLKISVPDTANENDVDLSTIFGNSIISSYYDSALDNTTAKILLTYNDSIRQSQASYFKINQTVYAKATGLLTTTNIYFVWIDSNATIIRISPDISVNSEGKAYDELNLNGSSRIGNWTLVLYNAFNDREITREYFYLKVAPNVNVIYPNGGEILYGTEIINWSANDYENDTLNFTIKYSPDNGTSWFTIISGLPNGTTNYSWDTTSRYDGTNYLIKIIAYDWFQSGEDISDSLFAIDNTNIIINSINDSPDPVLFIQSINITANVTSTAGVDSIWVFINGTNYTMNYYSGNIWYFDEFNISNVYAGVYDYTVYANNTNGYDATPVSGNFTITSFVSIIVSNVPINFSNVLPGGTTNATSSAGWPAYVKNDGNVKVNISMNGSNLIGQTDETYIINLGNVYWDFTDPFNTNHVLTSLSTEIITELEMNNNRSLYFKLNAPLNIKSQDYIGNITLSGIES